MNDSFFEVKMKKITVFLLFFAVFFTFSTMFAEDDDKLILAVMEFEDKSGQLSENTLSNATEYIRSAFVASNKFIVIAKERQEKAIIKQMKAESYKLCNDKNCQIPLGKALSADTILRTSINFFGGTYTITTELINLEKEATEVGTNSTFNGDENSLKAALDAIVAKIIGNMFQQSNVRQGRFKEKPNHNLQIGANKAFIVKFLSNPQEAAVIVDGKMICDRTPCSKQIDFGVHTVEMQKEDYLPSIKEENISGERIIDYKLEEDFARLNISGNYSVEVLVDGKNVGKLPMKNLIVKAGAHRIGHKNGCYYNSGEDIVVKRGEKKYVYLQLERRVSAIQVNIKDINNNDIKGDVYVDGQYIGIAPNTFKLPLCSHELTIISGNGEYRQYLNLQEGQISNILALITYGRVNTSYEAYQIKNEKIKEELNKAGRKTRLGIATGFFIPGIALTILGGVSFYEMNEAEKDRKEYYGRYLDAENEEQIVLYRKKAQDADKRRKTYAILGGVGIGVGIAMMTTGIVFYSIDFKGEKEVKKKYNLSFGTSPMDGTLQFAVRW